MASDTPCRRSRALCSSSGFCFSDNEALLLQRQTPRALADDSPKPKQAQRGGGGTRSAPAVRVRPCPMHPPLAFAGAPLRSPEGWLSHRSSPPAPQAELAAAKSALDAWRSAFQDDPCCKGRAPGALRSSPLPRLLAGCATPLPRLRQEDGPLNKTSLRQSFRSRAGSGRRRAAAATGRG